jgi:hypothetical protein
VLLVVLHPEIKLFKVDKPVKSGIGMFGVHRHGACGGIIEAV